MRVGQPSPERVICLNRPSETLSPPSATAAPRPPRLWVRLPAAFPLLQSWSRGAGLTSARTSPPALPRCSRCRDSLLSEAASCSVLRTDRVSPSFCLWALGLLPRSALVSDPDGVPLPPGDRLPARAELRVHRGILRRLQALPPPQGPLTFPATRARFPVLRVCPAPFLSACGSPPSQRARWLLV